MNKTYPEKVRKGKTAKDHKSGSWARRFTNLALRGAWSRGDEKAFPAYTCRGKGNSSKAVKH